jgi:signal transduction histidine kinase
VQHSSLSEFVAASLVAHAAPLARHWLERAAAATPRPPAAQPDAPAGVPIDAIDTSPASPPDPAREAAEFLVLALAAGVRVAEPLPADTAPHNSQDARPAADVMRLGWAAGGAAYAAGHSVHHVARDADLLLAVILADVERTLADVPPGPGAAAVDGVAVARRLQRAVGRYAQAALSGFVHALLRGLRERYRLLRHDLRNPLGTIRSALSLMEDESVPVETRQGPNIRAMVARNAGSLDRLIARRLDDASAAALLAPPYTVRVRDVALAARREVREAARLAGCEVTVDVPDDAPSRVDGAALELTLTTLLLAALSRASAGDRVYVRCADRVDLATAPGGGTPEPPMCAVLALAVERDDGASPCPPGGAVPCWDEQGIDLASTLALDYGGRLGASAAVGPAEDAAALVQVLARAPVVYLRLPLVEPDVPSASGTRAAPAPEHGAPYQGSAAGAPAVPTRRAADLASDPALGR